MPPPPFWDPSSFSFKNFGPSSCAFLIKCTQQYLRTPINIMRNIWAPQTYFSWNWIKHLFNWHSEASSHYWQSRITSLQITISKLTEVNEKLKASEASLSLSLPLTSDTWQPLTACLPLAALPPSPLYPQFPQSNALTEFLFFLALLSTPSSSEPIRTCLSKIMSSEHPDKPYISYVP